MIDRSEYALLGLAEIHTYQVQMPDTDPRPETSKFIIFGKDDDGQQVAIAIPFSALGDLPEALAAATKQFPEGQRLQ